MTQRPRPVALRRVDLNNDGKDDLLATTYRQDGLGVVAAYEAPATGLTGNWTRSAFVWWWITGTPGLRQCKSQLWISPAIQE